MGNVSAEAEAALAELSKFGIKGEVVDRGKHLAVEWNYSDGRYRQVFTARTGSDWRGPLNVRARVRRILREANITLPPPSIVIFEKALNLPKPTDFAAEKIRRLENDVEALCDLCLEQSLRLEALEKRLAGLRVSVSFEEVAIKTTELSNWRANSMKQRPAVLNYLSDGLWHNRNDIAKVTEIPVNNVSRVLNQLLNAGMVENGQRGMWRKVVEPAAQTA